MNATSGFYQFYFKGLKEGTMEPIEIQLRVNKVPVAFAFAEGNLFRFVLLSPNDRGSSSHTKIDCRGLCGRLQTG